jgi:murein DD-endopeptidase MepM/ murein hydrolase activator NlpD
MSEHLHILITSDGGKGRNFILSKHKLKSSILCLGVLLLIFCVTGYNALHSINENIYLSKQTGELHEKITSLASKLAENESTNTSLILKIRSLEKRNSIQAESFRQEKDDLLNTAVSELEERSDMIERLMCNIGVDIKNTPKTDNSNSGGPFIAPRENIGKELLFRSDKFLNTINIVPLGRPVPGKVTSRFGLRSDPKNGKDAFHSGVDMRGHTGEKVIATADGVVTKALWNGGYGKYIEIDHGNGYTTKFGHLSKLLVKRGDKVTRGQKIGTVGNTGRSTGPHLHYEISLYDKPVNPAKFMYTKKLTQAAGIAQLNTTNTKKLKHLLVVEKQQPPSITAENSHGTF